MGCNDCERRRRYMAADPEMYRDEDTRCDAHQAADVIATLRQERDEARAETGRLIIMLAQEQCDHEAREDELVALVGRLADALEEARHPIAYDYEHATNDLDDRGAQGVLDTIDAALASIPPSLRRPAGEPEL